MEKYIEASVVIGKGDFYFLFIFLLRKKCVLKDFTDLLGELL